MADLDELEERRQGEEHFGTDAIALHRRPGDAPDLQLDDHRLRRRVRHTALGFEHSGHGPERDGDHKRKRPDGERRATVHGTTSWTESRTVGAGRMSFGSSKSARSATTS